MQTITKSGHYPGIQVDATGTGKPAIIIRIRERSKYKPVFVTITDFYVRTDHAPAVQVYAGKNTFVTLMGGYLYGNISRLPADVRRIHILAKRAQQRHFLKRKRRNQK